jgi:hypothetical protein
VNRWVRVAAWVLLACWLPATLHCALEVLPGFASLQCCCGDAAPGTPEPAGSPDACASLEGGFIKHEDQGASRLIPPVWPALMTELALGTEASPAAFDFRSFPVGPPELPRAWQFFCRAAAQPRAPSGVS